MYTRATSQRYNYIQEYKYILLEQKKKTVETQNEIYFVRPLLYVVLQT